MCVKYMNNYVRKYDQSCILLFPFQVINTKKKMKKKKYVNSGTVSVAPETHQHY